MVADQRSLARSVSLGATAVLALFASSSVVSASSPGEGAEGGGTLTVALSLEPDSLDLGAAAQAASHQVALQIYDTLIWFDADAQEFVPGLATDWVVSDDGLTYTFTLRDDVTFHDGTEFDADAVKVAFDRILDPEFTSPTARPKLGPVDAINVIDPTTVEIVLETPFPSLLNGLSQGGLAIPSPAAIEEYGDEFGRHPVGTGPMSFVEWTAGDSITLANNPDYDWAPDFLNHEGPADLDELVFKVVADNVARPAALESGDVQVAWNLPAADFFRLEAGGNGVTTLNTPWSGASISLFLNSELGPTDDLAVRQAVLYGLDRQELIDTALFSVYQPAEGPLSPATLFYSDEVEGMYPHDPDQAKTLLEEAGWTGDGVRTKDGEELALHIITLEQFRPIATTIQGLLAPIGFAVEVDVRDAAAAVDANSNGEGTGGITGLVDSDPAGIQLFWSSENYGGFNWSRVQDPEIDALLAAQAGELDVDARAGYFADLQTHIMENALIYPIYQGAFLWGLRDEVQGFETDGLGYPYYVNVWLDQ